MTRRVFEIAFSHKLLFIAPIVLGCILGVAAMLYTYEEAYQTGATLWVDKPAEASLIDYNAFLSSSENQARHMNELLNTRDFAEGVLARAGEAGIPEAALPTSETLRGSVNVLSTGEHLMVVMGRGPTPQVAQSLVNATIDEYTQVQFDQYEGRNLRLQEQYQGQLEVANLEFQAANRELADYLVANPLLPDQSMDEAAALDPELTRLMTSEQTARAAYETFLSRYADSVRAATQSQPTLQSFYIVDEPELPAAPVPRTKRELAVLPMAGLIVGGLVSAGLFLLLWRLDRTIRTRSDLELLGLHMPVMSVPAMRPKRRLPLTAVSLAVGVHSGFRNGVSPEPSEAYEAIPEPEAGAEVEMLEPSAELSEPETGFEPAEAEPVPATAESDEGPPADNNIEDVENTQESFDSDEQVAVESAAAQGRRK